MQLHIVDLGSVHQAVTLVVIRPDGKVGTCHHTDDEARSESASWRSVS
jgi:hypothetical protein